METYDVAVIGGGVAGLQAAFRAVARDRTVALVEKEVLGGTCLTRGCIPTKAMVRSAEVAHLARRAEEFGIDIEGEIEADMNRVVDRKDRIVEDVVDVNRHEVAETDAVDLYEGTATFEDPHTLRVDGDAIGADQIILATGARPFVPDWPGVDEVDPLTSRELLDLDEVPDELIVVGGGYIGLECAQILGRLGSDVTVVQRSVILKQEDQQLIDLLRERLEAEGIELREGTGVERLEAKGDRVLVHGADEDNEPVTITGDELLVAVGREPVDGDLNLDQAGVETWGPGWIETDDQLGTTQENIWAVGDCIGEQMFTHVARYEVEVAIRNALEDGEEAVDYFAAPYAVFTDPQLGRVGMTLEEAEDAGYDAMEAEWTFEHLGKALCLGETDGMMKAVADRETGQLLGFHCLAHEGAELVHEAIVVMNDRGTVEELSDAIHIHPTMAEGVNDTAYTAAIRLGRREW
ncbi:dihydrolipoamide dehydrogenase [Thermoplasmatales archaeon SW_10_69_26]|nr:MAG: dihydrolipoamide dehydrogenase [Thermoplasmatales archaeon SW_10_69_26]